jgi:hypothetical protein
MNEAKFKGSQEAKEILPLLLSWSFENRVVKERLWAKVVDPKEIVFSNKLQLFSSKERFFIESYSEEKKRSYLTDLHLKLWTSNEDDMTNVVTITGMGGLGKTTLALKYACEAKNNGAYKLIWWFNCYDLKESVKETTDVEHLEQELIKQYIALLRDKFKKDVSDNVSIELANKILDRCAYLDPNCILMAFFTDLKNQEKFEEVFGDLIKFSLIQNNEEIYSVHPMTQFVLREYKALQEALKTVTNLCEIFLHECNKN